MRSRLCDLRFLGCAWGNHAYSGLKPWSQQNNGAVSAANRDLSIGGKEHIWKRPFFTGTVKFQYPMRLQNFWRATEKDRRLRSGATAGTLVRVILKQCSQMFQSLLSLILLWMPLSETSRCKNCKTWLPNFLILNEIWSWCISFRNTRWNKSDRNLESARWQSPSGWKNC